MAAGDDNSLHLSDFDGAPARPDDRRREPRVACERPIAVLPYPNKKFISGHFVDCSVRGVGLVLKESLPVEERFLLKLRGESLTLLIYSIRNCRASAGSCAAASARWQTSGIAASSRCSWAGRASSACEYTSRAMTTARVPRRMVLSSSSRRASLASPARCRARWRR